jgi:hypothetical protein
MIVDRRPYPIADSHSSIAHASILRRHGSAKKRDGMAESGKSPRSPGILLQRGTDDLNLESKSAISLLTVTPCLARDMRSVASIDVAPAAFPSMAGRDTAAPDNCACCRDLSIGCQRPPRPATGSQWSKQPTASRRRWSSGPYRSDEGDPEAARRGFLRSRGSAQSLIYSCEQFLHRSDRRAYSLTMLLEALSSSL